MRLAISNIAWDVPDDEAMAVLLNARGVDAIDVAPGKYFPDPAKATDQDIARVKAWWAARGIEITGMQSLLFGTTGLNLFGAADVQDAMLRHLSAVCRIGGGLGARRLVFGSPKNRDRTGFSDTETDEMAASFFSRLGDAAQSFDVVVCLEPNPARYGANFMTSSFATARVVERVRHPAIRMQLDTGALTINQESASAVLEACAGLIGHIHASEPDSVPLGAGGTDHGAVARVVRQHLPGHVVSIEMLSPKNEPHLESIKRALEVADENYRRPIGTTQ